MSRLNISNKRNLSSTSLTSSSPKTGEKKSKIFVSTNKYATSADDFDSSTEVFSSLPVTTSPYIQDAVTIDSKSTAIVLGASEVSPNIRQKYCQLKCAQK